MREIHDHKVGVLNEDLNIVVYDDPGAGGACHDYGVTYNLNPGTSEGGTNGMLRVKFQNGPIKESGVNGVTQEVLMAICIDRLRSFQAGPYSCKENAVALTHLETALLWLQKRTLDRMRRGVEGTNQK